MQGPDYHVSSQLRQVFVTVSRPVQVCNKTLLEDSDKA